MCVCVLKVVAPALQHVITSEESVEREKEPLAEQGILSGGECHCGYVYCLCAGSGCIQAAFTRYVLDAFMHSDHRLVLLT